ncbi:MAG: hypothetical protein HYX87_02945 [Chloroflexi bacterium]|nr:hypothetical protein [Chloroflexota bacterium]
MSASDPLVGICNTCTIRLVRIAYRRRPWFRLLREPLRAGMVLMGWLYRVNPGAYSVPESTCTGCLRFTKQALRERSGLFRRMNARINPRFDRVLESIVTPEEVTEARQYASRSTRRQ